MHIYLSFLLVLLGAGSILMVAIYLKFKNGLTSKMFALIIPAEMVVAQAAFVVGNEGLEPGLLSVAVPLAVAAVTAAMFAIYRIAIKPLTPLTETMTHIANNRDLSTLPPVSDRRDEIHAIESAFRTMTANLRDVIGRLQEGITGVASSATEISATAQQAVATASEQASVVAEVSTTVEEIKQTSQAAADSAHQVASVSDDALDGGRRGMASVEEAVDVVQAISERAGAVATKMQQLSEKADQIGDIITTVNELAEQSNLLAVNASIEAARAGDQGRGFAVVASEVRSLAEQSKASTKQIQSILGDIKRSTEGLLVAAEESQQRTQDGERVIEVVRGSVMELLAVLEENSSQARQISGASSQQAAGIKQIADAMEHVARGGRDTQDSAEQLEQAVVNLGDIGNRLKAIAIDYRV